MRLFGDFLPPSDMKLFPRIMTTPVEAEIAQFMQGLEKRNPHETEFHQAVR